MQDFFRGLLSQKTSFPFEVIINDDASTDGTRSIIEEYAKQYPRIIRPILQEENHYSRGTRVLATFVLPRARGTYVAFCEGDDFWTDRHKLARQVRFMEQHRDCTISFHPVRILADEDGSTRVSQRDFPHIFDSAALGDGNFIYTASAVARRSAVPEIPGWYFSAQVGDYPLFLLYATAGSIGFLSSTMAVYRVHSSSSWSSMSKANQLIRAFELAEVLYEEFRSNDRLADALRGQANDLLARLSVVYMTLPASDKQAVLEQIGGGKHERLIEALAHTSARAANPWSNLRHKASRKILHWARTLHF